MSDFPTGHEILSKLTNTSSAISVQTNFTPTSAEETEWHRTFKIRISSRLDYTPKYGWKTVKVSVGCYNETSLSYTVKPSLAGKSIFPVTGDFRLIFVMRKVDSSTSDPSIYLKEWNMIKDIETSSNIDGCGAGKVYFWSDTGYS
jgi:hypothetical protein